MAAITIFESDDASRSVILPLSPATFPDSGSAKTRSFDIIGSGPHSRPAGRAEKHFPLQGVLPGPARQGLPNVHDWRPPADIVNQMTDWVDRSVALTLYLDTPAGIGQWPVYLSRYEFTRTGGYGDIAFDVEFVEWRTVTITLDAAPPPIETTQAPAEGLASGAAVETALEAEARIANGLGSGGLAPGVAPPPPNYVVQDGDTLQLIARKLLGDSGRWREIWKINPISDPNAITPGMVLLVPGKTQPRTDLPADLYTPQQPVGGGPF